MPVDINYVISALLHRGVYYCTQCIVSIHAHTMCRLVSLVAEHATLDLICGSIILDQIGTHFRGIDLHAARLVREYTQYRSNFNERSITQQETQTVTNRGLYVVR